MVKIRTTLGLLLGVYLGVLSVNAFAEDEDKGRLADGRAFRTGSDGIQLVDHVAELELQIEALTRRLEAAENEIQYKDSLLTEEGQRAAIIAECPEVPSDKLQCPPTPQFSCDSEEVAMRLAEAPEIDNSELLTLRQRIADLESKNEILEIQKEKDSQWFELTLDARDQEIAALKSSRPKSVSQAAARHVDSGARAGLKLTSLSEQVVNKKTLDSQIASAREMLSERDKLFSDLSTESASVKVRPSSLENGSQRNLDMIAQDLAKDSSVTNLSALFKEVSEIKHRLQDDIETARRLAVVR